MPILRWWEGAPVPGNPVTLITLLQVRDLAAMQGEGLSVPQVLRSEVEPPTIAGGYRLYAAGLASQHSSRIATSTCSTLSSVSTRTSPETCA